MGVFLVMVLMFAMSDAMLYGLAIFAVVCLILSYRETKKKGLE